MVGGLAIVIHKSTDSERQSPQKQDWNERQKWLNLFEVPTLIAYSAREWGANSSKHCNHDWQRANEAQPLLASQR